MTSRENDLYNKDFNIEIITVKIVNDKEMSAVRLSKLTSLLIIVSAILIET